MSVKIDEDKCTGCGICAQICPVDAIAVGPVAKIDREICTGCGRCVAECPNEAIHMDGIKTLSPPKATHTSLSRISARRSEPSETTAPRVFGDRPRFQRADKNDDFLMRIFNFFAGSAGRGYGKRRGCDGRRGRRKRRRT